MKTYLNRQERHDWIVLKTFEKFIVKLIDDWARHGGSKSKLKFARTALTMLRKVLQEITGNLSEQELTRLLNDAQKQKVMVSLNGGAIREYERTLKLKTVIPVDAEDLKDLTDFVLMCCQKCPGKLPCKLYDLLVKYDIPVFDCHAPHGTCPYVHPDLGFRSEVLKSIVELDKVTTT